jgi:hypothetical protein
MTDKEMIGLLDLYLGPGKLGVTTLITLLNAAVQKLPSLIEGHIINAVLGTSQTGIPLDENNSFDLNDLTVDIWEGPLGIVELKSNQHRHIIYRKESQEEYEHVTERGRFHHHTKPKYRTFGSKIFCSSHHPAQTDIVNVPSTGPIVAGVTYYVTGYTSLIYNIQTYHKWDSFVGVVGQDTYGTIVGSGYVSAGNRLVDIFYRRQPTAIAGDTNASDLSLSMQKIVIGLACEDINKSKYELALSEIKLLNETIPPTESNEIPTMEILGQRHNHEDWM